MDLYLIDCEREARGDSVDSGPLNRQWRCLIRESARKIAKSGIVVEEIRYSDTPPAEQVARIHAKHLDSPSGDIRVEALESRTSVKALSSCLNQESGSVMLIANRDFLHRLVGELVANDPELDLMTFAGNCVVHLNRSQGNWTVIAGDEVNVRKVRLRDWLYDFFDSILSVDGRFQVTLRTLLFKPGRLSTEWLAGNRTLYAPPLRIYIVCSAILFGLALLALALSDASPLVDAQEVRTAVDTSATAPTSLIYELTAHARQSGAVDKAIVEATQLAPYLTIAMVPALALALMLVFRRNAYLYLEHLVFAVHLKAFWLLSLSLLITFTDLISQQIPLFRTAIVETTSVTIVLGIALIYSVMAVRVFYDESWRSATLKAICTLVVYALSLLTAIVAASNFRVTATTPEIVSAHDRYSQIMESWHADEPVGKRAIYQAIVAYLRIPGYDYAYPHTQIYVSELLMVAGQLEEARSKVTHVLFSQPENAYALAVAASVNCKLEDIAEVRELLERYHSVYDKLHAEGNPPTFGKYQPLVERYLACAEKLTIVDQENHH